MLERDGGDRWGADDWVKLNAGGYPFQPHTKCTMYAILCGIVLYIFHFRSVHCYARH